MSEDRLDDHRRRSTIPGSTSTATSPTPPLAGRWRATTAIFVAEGTAVIRRLLGSTYPVRSAAPAAERAEALAPDLEVCAASVFVAERSVLAEVAGFDVHRGALAIADRRALAEPSALLTASARDRRPRRSERPREPGRHRPQRRRAGVDALLLDPTCADPLYRRGSTGLDGRGPVPALDPAHAVARRAGTGACGRLRRDRADAGARRRALGTGAGRRGRARRARSWAPRARACQRRRSSRPTTAPASRSGPGVDSLNVGHAAAIAFHSVARRRP